MLGRTTVARLAVMAVVTLIMGCMKATTPQGAAQVNQLIEHIETVAQWSRGPDRAQRTAWLDRSVVWDIVGAVEMTTAAAQVEDSRVDAVLRSGLAELAAGPGDHIASLVAHWRKALGTGSCRSAAASDDDVRWGRERLTMPAPTSASADVQSALAGYANRAKATQDFVRIDCGDAVHLVVGLLGDRLVPILRR